MLGFIMAGLLAGAPAPLPASAQERAPQPIACPDSLGDGVRCHSGRDARGAWYVAAVPQNWNGKLVVHAHGGPRTGAPEAEDPLEDLDRFSMMARAGYGWIGSTYRRGGYGVRMAAEDVETSRQLFQAHFGRPSRTYLHGQSWGGNVAAKAAELYARGPEGEVAFDGVLLTNGLLAGGTRAYGFRADLRAVYQYYCRNHPGPAETAYPLWSGLAADSDLTRSELRRRIDDCTGVDRPASERTPEQQARLDDITRVIGITPNSLVGHMNWATFLFQDMVQARLDGGNPFDNHDTVYRGSGDDQALNAGVERFRADPDAVARLAYDADLSGLIVAPTVTIHALHDPTVFFDQEADYARTVERAGRAHLLVQSATDEDQHSLLAAPQYLVVLEALDRWVETGERPDPAGFQARCLELAKAEDCRFVQP